MIVRVPPFPEPTDEWNITVTVAGIGYYVEIHEDRSGTISSRYALTRAGAERSARRYIRRERRSRQRTRDAQRLTVGRGDR